MPLPPLPKAMGSILKEGEMTVKAASNPKSLKTEVKEKPVVSGTNKVARKEITYLQNCFTLQRFVMNLQIEEERFQMRIGFFTTLDFLLFLI